MNWYINSSVVHDAQQAWSLLQIHILFASNPVNIVQMNLGTVQFFTIIVSEDLPIFFSHQSNKLQLRKVLCSACKTWPINWMVIAIVADGRRLYWSVRGKLNPKEAYDWSQIEHLNRPAPLPTIWAECCGFNRYVYASVLRRPHNAYPGSEYSGWALICANQCRWSNSWFFLHHCNGLFKGEDCLWPVSWGRERRGGQDNRLLLAESVSKPCVEPQDNAITPVYSTYNSITLTEPQLKAWSKIHFTFLHSCKIKGLHRNRSKISGYRTPEFEVAFEHILQNTRNLKYYKNTIRKKLQNLQFLKAVPHNYTSINIGITNYTWIFSRFLKK